MRKKPEYESRSNEARRNRRIERSARKTGKKKGKKTPVNGTSDVGDAIRLELETGNDLRQILRDLTTDADPRVRLPAVRLMLELEKDAKPNEPTVQCEYCRPRVRKPWPYADGLGDGDPNEAMRRYLLMISGEYEMPQAMERVHSAAV
jgi:hypothetical protein